MARATACAVDASTISERKGQAAAGGRQTRSRSGDTVTCAMRVTGAPTPAATKAATGVERSGTNVCPWHSPPILQVCGVVASPSSQQSCDAAIVAIAAA